MKSKLYEGKKVTFPEFTGERVYMHPFKIIDGLPESLSRWDKTVETMLEGIETEDYICLTIDQGCVNKGFSQRRGGMHIDCNYDLGTFCHAGNPPNHVPAPPSHRPNPPTHLKSLSHGHKAAELGGGVIFAASHIGCQAWKGDIDGWPEMYGDCSHLNVNGIERQILKPNRCYLGNVTMLHETLKAENDQDRTFIRLSLPDSYAA